MNREHYLRLFANKTADRIAQHLIADLQGYNTESVHRGDDEERLVLAIEVIVQKTASQSGSIPQPANVAKPDDDLSAAEWDYIVQTMKNAEESGQQRNDAYYRHLASMIGTCMNSIHQVIDKRLDSERGGTR